MKVFEWFYYYLFQYILFKTHLKLGITRFFSRWKQKGQKKSKIFQKSYWLILTLMVLLYMWLAVRYLEC